MKKWFYSNVSLLWLIALLIVMCVIGYVVYNTVSSDMANTVFSLLLVVELIAAPVGMVAFGIWGENKIEQLKDE